MLPQEGQEADAAGQSQSTASQDKTQLTEFSKQRVRHQIEEAVRGYRGVDVALLLVKQALLLSRPDGELHEDLKAIIRDYGV